MVSAPKAKRLSFGKAAEAKCCDERVRDLILQADDELRYPTSGELRSMEAFLNDGSAASALRVLTDNERKIVDESAKQLFSLQTGLRAPGGNANGQKQRAQCLRDLSWYLRLVTYGGLAGSTSFIESTGLIGTRDVQQPRCSHARHGRSNALPQGRIHRLAGF